MTLEQWLTRATRGLSDAAAAQVRAEIHDHYLSALEAAGADGPEAEAQAVATLGDAAAASRQYRRVLLTKGDAILLRALSGQQPAGASERRWILGKGLAALLMVQAVAFMVLQALRVPAFGYLFAAFMLQIALFHFVHSGSMRAGRIVRAFRWALFAAGAGLAIANGLPAGHVPAFAAVVAYTEYRRLVLRRKLPQAQWPTRLYN